MDTQGAVGLIVDGGGIVLKKYNLKILMEFCPNKLENVGSDPLKLLHKLKNYGFIIKRIDEGNQCLKPIKIAEIAKMSKSRKNVKGEVNLFLEK